MTQLYNAPCPDATAAARRSAGRGALTLALPGAIVRAFPMPASLSSPARGAESPRRFEHETLAFLAGLVDLSGAVFYSVDPDLNAVDHALRDVDPTLLPAYVRHFHKLDPLHPRRLAASGRSLVTLQDVVPRAALERSSYYRDFMRPLGMYHEAELVLRDGAAVVGGISLLRDESRPAFGAAELALLARVRPYVEYAFRSCRVGAPALGAPTLTPREREVARLVCRGESNRGIARALGIALPTVKSHLEHVYAKLGVRSRTQLVVRLGSASSGRPGPRTFG